MIDKKISFYFLISFNSAGINRGRQFLGHSLVVDPIGQIIAGNGVEKCIIWVEIERALVLTAREEFPPSGIVSFKISIGIL